MANKRVEVEGVGEVALYKRRGTRSIRVSITPKGQVRVTMPYWVPYASGEAFVRSKRQWIVDHRGNRESHVLMHGQAIGKHHRLVLERSPTATKVTSRVETLVVRVTYPASLAGDDPAVQSAAQRAGIRALRRQAEELLPGRLRALAIMHDFTFDGVEVKQLTGRWGSCDAKRHIILNLFLMELPLPLIDYVLLHELTHTEVLRHGPDFWQAMARVLPDVQVRRKAIKSYRPVIGQPDILQ